MTYQEALVWLDKDSEAKSKLKGKWGSFAGKGRPSGYYTFDNQGKLIEVYAYYVPSDVARGWLGWMDEQHLKTFI